MPAVNISEKEFVSVAGIAIDLWREGRKEDAIVFDELARKMNHALTLTANTRTGAMRIIPVLTRLKLSEVESPLESAGLRTAGRRS